MKKLLKYIITFIFIIILIPKVNAFQVGEEFTISNSGSGNSSGVGFPYGYSVSSATQVSTGKTFEAFCLERNKSAPTASTIYLVDRIMPSETSKSVAKYDYAALYIINSEASYEEKHLAIRFLTDVIVGYSDTKTVAPDYYIQEVAAIAEFMKDSSFSTVYNDFTSKSLSSSQTFTGNISQMSGVKSVLRDGMNFANEMMKDNQNTTKVEKGESGEVSKESNGGMVTYKKIVSIKLDIYNILNDSDDEYFKIVSEPEIEAYSDQVEVTMLGVSETFIDSEDGWDSISIGEDLSKKLDDRKGTLYLGFLVTLTTEDQSESAEEEEEEDCTVKITINYEYTSPYSGAVLKHSNASYRQSSQKFIIASTDPIKGEFTLETNLCSEATCDPTITVPTLCEP
ncbi:MAG: hypothetical protein ACI4XR_04795, partial [Bacilli bacterium]